MEMMLRVTGHGGSHPGEKEKVGYIVDGVFEAETKMNDCGVVDGCCCC